MYFTLLFALLRVFSPVGLFNHHSVLLDVFQLFYTHLGFACAFNGQLAFSNAFTSFLDAFAPF